MILCDAQDPIDHIFIFGEAHLRRIMRAYLRYFISARTHLSFEKNSSNKRQIQNAGVIISIKHLGGLHHEYGRI